MEDNQPTAISIEGISKQFRMPIEAREKTFFHGWLGFAGKKKKFDALRNVDLSIRKGEMLGVIGMNGSGKSTLLKIIAGIATPTVGRVQVNGRIGSLIELGAGFHPELSGYENVYLNGTILGLERSSIDDLLPDIIEFAGLEGFMDMPVKHYSSGMQMRLGFSIAIQLRPDILLLDETMSVGDSEFQSRALKAIHDHHATGATILMVSHDVISIREYCQRALWLHKGEVKMLGPAREVVEAYRDFLLTMGGETSELLLASHGDKLFSGPKPDDSPIEITGLSVSDGFNPPALALDHPARICLSISYRSHRPIGNVRIRVGMVFAENLVVVLEKDSTRDSAVLAPSESGAFTFSFDATRIYSGRYRFIVALCPPDGTNQVWSRETIEFDLQSIPQPLPGYHFYYYNAPCRDYEHIAGGN